ncbi:orotidine-5'-phosphate decarboxylase [Liquorilactobacillus vini]|uniref:Orotidine 5'-phosphate decarboxylase n=1 Tax=Liquorilactobacillus vini DSM 20605 TaxID=1133569 RepID=A0A0R2CD56_9LACO|nr:orotidine-5'-phosphate decarboxylase [Liquorilactobacillus vini]KRM89026.1 orotidine 5-phosphate decarboxylase [Liquorilactobacillus vini DSM 20605]
MKIERPIIALDFPDKQTVDNFLKKFPANQQLFVKIGMELFYSEGQTMVQELIAAGHDVFLDLKCHDIPHTVEAAMRVIGKLGVKLTTIHASGGTPMMEAAVSGLVDGSNGDPSAKILAITQLTSTTEKQLQREQLVTASMQTSVLNYAALAQQAGLGGVVCSAWEAAAIQAQSQPNFLRVTPGIRLAGNSHDDQKRVMTPDQAASNGSSAIVVGRAITQAADPVAAYQLVEKLWRKQV